MKCEYSARCKGEVVAYMVYGGIKEALCEKHLTKSVSDNASLLSTGHGKETAYVQRISKPAEETQAQPAEVKTEDVPAAETSNQPADPYQAKWEAYKVQRTAELNAKIASLRESIGRMEAAGTGKHFPQYLNTLKAQLAGNLQTLQGLE